MAKEYVMDNGHSVEYGELQNIPIRLIQSILFNVSKFHLLLDAWCTIVNLDCEKNLLLQVYIVQ